MAAASALSELCNGERFVVAIFLSRVLYSSPSAASLEALALSILALAALTIEIFAERSPAALHTFKIRPGASSGILLGTVTLPTVMLSRLIQLSRYDAGFEEFAYVRMQYWAVSISCLGILTAVYLTLHNSSIGSISSPVDITLLVGLALYGGIAHFSLTARSTYDMLVAIKMLWFVSHALASVGLIRHILYTFPSCASIGESLLVSSGVVTYFGDLLVSTLSKINSDAFSFLSEYDLSQNKSEIGTIIQGLIFGLLSLPLLYKIVLKFSMRFTKIAAFESHLAEGRGMRDIGQSILFYGTFGITVVMMVPYWMQFVGYFNVHPALWIFGFLFADPQRLLLCIWWISIIFAAVFWFYNISKHSKIERILLRKYYHLVAVAMFSPALIIQPNFLDLAFGVALSAFLALEMVRVWKIWPFGELIDRFMNAFTDHRDSDILIISHFSLLLGCALPKWMSFGFNDRPLAPFAGILSLGIGDTMASVIGHKYGTLRWSKSGKKTIEGTAAGIMSVLVACSILLSILASTGYILSQHWFSLLVAVTVSGLLEAYTMQLDNAFIPLVFYSLLCL